MSKTWYPVIDYVNCIECGVCTNKCTHGVYDLEKAPTPVVVAPENCVHGCHGCGSLCLEQAIQYVGDKSVKNGNCGCFCENNNEGCC